MVGTLSIWVLSVILASLVGCNKKDPLRVASENGSQIYMETPSARCEECHQEVYDRWVESDHFHANDLFRKSEWEKVFNGYRVYVKSGRVSEFLVKKGEPTIRTIGLDGVSHDFHPEMTLAYSPMVQFLVPFPGGRWQVTDHAWDMQKQEWFSVFDFEDDNRRPEEWGHWTQRGMNWNAQCGICHTTHFSKNYRIESDSYQSEWKEQGIACLQCHGAMPKHLANPDAPISDDEQVSSEAYYQSCYSCHSRREDITGDFRIGDRFEDHHRIQLPVSERYYFPDGQNKDEVFVYGSFLQSRMYQKGVRCMDCHDPHSMKVILPIENNQLCMVCHTAPGARGAIPVDPVLHGHHEVGSEGNRCVECHMPERIYMARDPRRDHGFHTPDPFLSQEIGVPNACINCHAEEGETWVMDAYEDWYGESEKRKTARKQARITNQAYSGDPDSVDDLLELLDESDMDIWRAAYAQMAMDLRPTPEVFARVLPYLEDDSYLVRSAILQTLTNYPGYESLIRPLLNDPARVVRVDAAWYLRNEMDPDSKVWKELMHYMRYTADQPGGALRWSEFEAGRGNTAAAEEWIDKVIEWDRTSVDAMLAKGFLLNRLGKPKEAILAFGKVFERDPQNPLPLYYQALIMAEQGDSDLAFETLHRVISIDPEMDRAWYNLGLLYNETGDVDSALSYLDQAISLNPEQPDYLYAKATILLRLNRADELEKTVESLILQFPNYAPGLQLRQLLINRSGSSR